MDRRPEELLPVVVRQSSDDTLAADVAASNPPADRAVSTMHVRPPTPPTRSYYTSRLARCWTWSGALSASTAGSVLIRSVLPAQHIVQSSTATTSSSARAVEILCRLAISDNTASSLTSTLSSVAWLNSAFST